MHLRARAALAVAAITGEREKVNFAEKLARRIEKEKMAWARPFTSLLRAAIAHQRNAASNALLADAIQGFDNGDMRLYAAAARRRLGETSTGAEGERLIAEADAWMTAQRIKNPTALTRMLAPGF
jgi:hypothetical protein